MTVLHSFQELELTRKQKVRQESTRVCNLVMSKMIRSERVKHPHKLIKRGFTAEVLRDREYQGIVWLMKG